MTSSTDRAAALTAAVKDIARDLHADLGKLSRYRGTDDPSSNDPTFKDPGPDLAIYERQKAEAQIDAEPTLTRYRAILTAARHLAGSVTDTTARGALLQLIQAAHDVDSLATAAALVATFEEA